MSDWDDNPNDDWDDNGERGAVSGWDDDDNGERGTISGWDDADGERGAVSGWDDDDNGERGTVSGWDDDADGERGAVSGWDDYGDGTRSIGGFPGNDASVNHATDAASANVAAAAAAPDKSTTAASNEADGDPDFGGVWRPHGRAKGKVVEGAVDVEGAASRRRYPRPRPPRPDCNVDFGLNRRRGGLEHRAFVSQLPFEVFEEELHEFFEAGFGPVKMCQVVRERSLPRAGRRDGRSSSYRSKGFGFVQFESAAGLEAALNATDEDLMMRGRRVAVDKARGDRRKDDDDDDDNDDDDDDDDDGAGDPDETPRDKEAGNDEIARVVDSERDAATSTTLVADIDDSLAALAIASSSSSSSPSSSTDLPPFDRLPDFVVVKIFWFLPLREKVGVELVSKRWQILARSSWASLREFSLPDFPVFYAFKTMIDDRLFSRLLNRMRDWRTNKSHLKKLDLSRSGLGFHALKTVAQTCPHLESLDLSGTRLSRVDSLRSIGGGCPNLRHFSLRDNVDVTEKALWYILKDCRLLERLDIRGCSRIRANFFHLANERLVDVNLERCARLKDASLVKLVANCPALKELNLSNCLALTADGIREIRRLAHLESLTMRQMNLPPEVSIVVGVVGPQLRSLDLAHNRCVDRSCLGHVFQRCPNLKRLNLAGCYALNGVYFDQFWPLLIYLEYVDLSYVELGFYFSPAPAPYQSVLKEAILVAVPNFDDRSLLHVLQFTALKFLDISGNFAVTGSAFQQHAKLCRPSGVENPLKIKFGGTEIRPSDLEELSDQYEWIPFDSSISSLRQDRHLLAMALSDSDDYDDDDDDDDDSFGVGGDLADLDYEDPMEEFERDWVS